MMMMMVHSVDDVWVISMPSGRMGPTALWKGSYCTVFCFANGWFVRFRDIVGGMKITRLWMMPTTIIENRSLEELL